MPLRKEKFIPEKVIEKDPLEKMRGTLRSIACGVIEAPENREKVVETLKEVALAYKEDEKKIFDGYAKELGSLLARERENLTKKEKVKDVLEEVSAEDLNKNFRKEIAEKVEKKEKVREFLALDRSPIKKILKKTSSFFRNNLGGKKLLDWCLALCVTLSSGSAAVLGVRELAERKEHKQIVEEVYKCLEKEVKEREVEEMLAKIIMKEKVGPDIERKKVIAEEEKKLLENAASLITGSQLSAHVYSGDKIYDVFKRDLPREDFKYPIKIDGKISSFAFTLPPDYSAYYNDKEVPSTYAYSHPVLEIQPELKDIMPRVYQIGIPTWAAKELGTISAVSQEKEIIISIKDKKGQEVGKIILEQAPAFLVDRVYYTNPKNEADSVNIYLTDLDTLKVYKETGKENIARAMREMAQGTIDIEDYFGLDIDVENWYLGREAEQANAFFQRDHPLSLYSCGDHIKKVGEGEEKGKMLRLVGRHESIHKLDWLLGEKDFLSNDERFKKICTHRFNEYKERLEKLVKEGKPEISFSAFLNILKKSRSLFYYIYETNFYNNPNAGGHPWANTQEFFESMVNTAMAENEELEKNFLSWPKKVREQYLKTIKLISQLLEEKKVDTSKLNKKIQFLEKVG